MRATFKRIFFYLKIVIIAGFLLSFLITILYRFIPPPVTPLMILRAVEMISNGKTVKIEKEWIPLNEMSPYLSKAIISSEDQKFLYHSGFDLDAIQKAWENNQKSDRKYLKGGSTVSQQVAKNVFLWPGRNWVRKGLEAYFTILIELFWSKERILEVYLNVIETGDGIYGAEAISMHCFKKSAGKLSREEAALIAATVPNPRRWSPCRPTSYIKNRKRNILKAMNKIDKVSVKK